MGVCNLFSCTRCTHHSSDFVSMFMSVSGNETPSSHLAVWKVWTRRSFVHITERTGLWLIALANSNLQSHALGTKELTGLNTSKYRNLEIEFVLQ